MKCLVQRLLQALKLAFKVDLLLRLWLDLLRFVERDSSYAGVLPRVT
jgi:hypothetical protein